MNTKNVPSLNVEVFYKTIHKLTHTELKIGAFRRFPKLYKNIASAAATRGVDRQVIFLLLYIIEAQNRNNL